MFMLKELIKNIQNEITDWASTGAPCLKKMQDNDIICREGSQKSGHWVIIRQNTDLE